MSATRTPVVRSDFAPGRWLGRVTAFLIAGFFAVFFVLPLVWLLLAPTKDTKVPVSLRSVTLTTGILAVLIFCTPGAIAL